MENETQDTIDYSEIMQEAVILIIRRALMQAAQNGLLGSNYFYISFLTQHEAVEMPEYLRKKHPEELTIILQNRYWDLEAHDHFFAVKLSFNQRIEQLKVPYDAINSFTDPSVPISFQLSEWRDLYDIDPNDIESTALDPNALDSMSLNSNALNSMSNMTITPHESNHESNKDKNSDSLFTLSESPPPRGKGNVNKKNNIGLKNKDAIKQKSQKEASQKNEGKKDQKDNVINLDQFRSKK